MPRPCGCCGEHGHFKPKCPNKAREKKKKEDAKAAKKALREKLRAEKRAAKLKAKQEAKALREKLRAEAKDAKLKAKEAERERKRVEKEIKKKLAPPKAGTSVKGRDGSTRHGYIISYSKYNSKPITETDIDNRNTRLDIDPQICFWCKLSKRECGDHLFPACSTKHSCYSFSTALCIVPSCSFCNSFKGGKIIEEWVKELPTLGWNPDQIKTLLEWTGEYKSKLVLQKSDVEHVENQFPEINKFHSVLEHCAKTKTDIRELITIYDPTTLAFGMGANLKQKKLTSYFK